MKKTWILLLLASAKIFSSTPVTEISNEAITQLQRIHSGIKLIHGDISLEYAEQLMASMYLPSDAKVLELGGNVGRNSCVISTILKNSGNLVTVEPSKIWARQIEQNRDYNNLHFYVEASAVSQVPLIQKGWITIPSEIDLPDYTRVDTITFNDLQSKYQITFDTLIADCEGALYYILKDDPNILTNIKLVIVENDYPSAEQEQFVSNLYIKNGLELVYTSPYYTRQGFYQVWKK